MYTDSHAHLTYLDLAPYDGDEARFLDALSDAKVSRVMAIMCRLDENDAIQDWCKKSRDGLCVGMSVGVHPCQDKATLRQVRADDLIALNTPSVWAIGETGLDYHWENDKKDEQKQSFAAHIHASQILGKPVIVHTRSAAGDTLDVLTAEKCEHGVIHCFTEDYAFAKKALDLGLYISFSGIVSFKKSIDLQNTAKKLPLDRLLIETDSPYLAPAPKRGKPNEPTFVPYVAAALGHLFGKSGEEIGRVTHQNFDDLLGQKFARGGAF